MKKKEEIMLDTFEDYCWKDVLTEDVFEIYRAFKRKVNIGQKPILLAIDLYNMAFEGGPQPVHEVVKRFPSSCGIYAWNALEPIKELLSITRFYGIPVIYTTGDKRNTAVAATKRQISNIDHGSYEIREEFHPEPEDLIICKARASAFFGTPLIAHLIQRGVDSVIVCGETTSGCVRASAVDAYSYGFNTVLVEECCFDRSILSHKINLFDMHHKYAGVMHLEEVKANLQRKENIA
jgi:maleamate amidohydrolase